MPTQQQIAEHLDIHQSEVSRHMERLNLDWRTESLDVIRVTYLRHLREMAAGHTTDDGESLVKERVLTERVDRELKLFQLAEKKGQLVNAEQLESEFGRMVGAFKVELLSRDDKLKADLDALYGIDADLQMLNEHTNAALAQLAGYDPDRAELVASTGAPDGAAAAAVDNGMVAPLSGPVGESLSPAGTVQP